MRRLLPFVLAAMNACESRTPTLPDVSVPGGGGVQASDDLSCEVFAYVTGESGEVFVIRTSDHTLVDAIPTGPLGALQYDVAITPDGEFAYLTDALHSVGVIRTLDRTVVTAIPLGTMQPLIIDITPDGQFAYVSNNDSDDVSVIRTSDNTVFATVTVGGSPFGLAISPDGTEVWVRDGVGTPSRGHVSIIRTSDNTVIGGFDLPSSSIGFAFTPDGQFAYIPESGNSKVAVVRTSDRMVVERIDVGSNPLNLAITHDGRFAYVTNDGVADEVWVIRTSDNTVVATIPLPAESNPGAVGVTPDDAFVYVVNFNAGTVSVIRVADNSIFTTIPGLNRSAGIAFTPCLPCTRLDLRDRVEALGPLGDGILNKGQTNALLRKLDQVGELIGKGKEDEAAGVLEDFLQQIKDLTAEGVLPPEEAADLIECAEDLLDTPATGVKIDGIKSPGEWNGASSVAVFSGTTLYYMNDDENLYLALEVEDETLTPEDRFEIRFDNTLDGVDTAGDDELNALLDDLSDQHFSPSWGVVDAQQDGEAAAGSSGGVNFFEVAHPLNSGDPDDFALSVGSSVGYCLRYFDDGTSTSSTSYPTDCDLIVNGQTLYDVLTIAGP